MSFGIHNGSISKKERILMLALKSPVHFGQIFLQSDFRVETASSYHYEMGNMMDDKKNLKPTIFMIARGHAKTKLTQSSIIKDICTYDWDEDPIKEHFIVWVAQNKTQSMRNVNFIKGQIETNDKIKYYFGDLRGSGKWNQEELDFKNKCSLICRAGLHGIRGLLKDHLRPNRFILDDFEYEGNTKTENSRNSNATTVSSVIIPALDPENGRLQLNQTPVHYDCFILRVYDNYVTHLKEGKDPDSFEWKIYKRATTIANPLWPEYIDRQKLIITKVRLKQAGQLNTWFQEYEMEVSTDETSLFGAKVINYWEGDFIKGSEQNYLHLKKLNNEVVNQKIPVFTFVSCDPSSDIETRDSSDSVVIEIAVDYEGRIFVIDYVASKNMPDRTITGKEDNKGISNEILERSLKVNAKRAGCESHAISSGVFSSIKSLKAENPAFRSVVVLRLSHKGENKIDRIYNGLINDFSSQKIFIKPHHERAEKEIETFGRFSKRMDFLDALEMGKRISYKPKTKILISEKRIVPLDDWEKSFERETSNWKTA